MQARSNTGGIKNLLLQHAEKIVLGVAVVLVALFLWSALSMKAIEDDKAPDKLAEKAKFEINRIQQSTAEDVPVAPKINYEARVVAALTPVATSAYTHTVKLDPEIQPALVKRPEPTLFPIEDLRATGVMTAIAEIGETPVWDELGKEKEKTKKAKKEPKASLFDADQSRPQPNTRRRSRGESGYGASAPRGRGAARGADADRGGPLPGHGGGGYGASDSSKAGYGASAGKGGYGASDSRDGAGSTGPVAYGGSGLSGADPGPPISGVQTHGVIRPAVVLTGRVPFGKQFDEFRKKFKDATPVEGRGPELDVPEYLQFKIERQEVTADGEGAWKPLDVYGEAVKAEGRWAVSPLPDDVDGTYLDPVLAWPMPPAIRRNWNRLATHPSIPLSWMVDATQTTTSNQPVDVTQILDSRRKTVERPDATGGFYGSGRDGYLVDPALAFQGPPVSSYLFRFVDTDKVEGGKQYRYRVSLEVSNPNFDVDPRILQETASSRLQSRWTPPADSPIVAVPHDRSLLALSVKTRSTALTDQQGEVFFHAWDKKMGAEVAKEFENIALGAIADFVTTVENWYNPYTAAGEKLENFPFRFDEGPPMLADIDGGAGLPGVRSVDQPAEMLFIDSKGRMFTTNEYRDAPTAEFYKQRYVVEAAPADAGTTILPDQAPARGKGAGGYGSGR